MKKTWQRLIVLFTVFCLLFTSFSGTALAAAPSVSSKKYLKTYPISTGNNTPVYRTSSCTGTKKGTIYASDELYVTAIGSTWAYCSYPTSYGRKSGYIRLSAITPNNFSKTSKATAKVNVYRRSNLSQYYGYAAKNDSIWVIGKTSSAVQIIYPAGSVYKMGWISMSNYNKYINTSNNNNNTNTTASRPIANGTYMIQSGNSSNRVLDINNWNMYDGGNLEIYQKNNTTNQRFVVTYVSNGYYKIKAYHSGKYLDVSGGSRSSGANAQQYTWNGTDAQLWRFISAGNGYYYIQSKLGTYLDNSGGSTANGNNVILYSFNGSNAQKWKFVSASTPSPSSTLKLSGQTYPGTMTQGSGFTVKGTVSSNYKISKITVGIYNANGAAVSTWTVYPNAYSYNLNKIDSYIHFSYAKPGTNYYRVVATDAKKSNVTLQNTKFTVKAKTITLDVINTILPTNASAKRQAVVNYMNQMAKIAWTPSTSFIHWSGKSNGPGTWKAGTTYYGIPYSQSCRTTNLSKFKSYLSGSKYVGPSGQSTYLGSDCSSAIAMAWNQVSPNFPTNKYTGSMLPTSSCMTKVGTYSATSSSTSTICTSNGKTKMFESYRKLQPGDAVLSTSEKHVMLVTSVSSSGITVTHQTTYNSNLKSTWRVNQTWSFDDLYADRYIPVTMTLW